MTLIGHKGNSHESQQIQDKQHKSNLENERRIVTGNETGRNLYNDVHGLHQKLKQITANTTWLEKIDVITKFSVSQTLMYDEIQGQSKNDNMDETALDRIHDDFTRENAFFKQAQEATREAICKLHDANVVTKRPNDYFAEMVKSDSHMQRIRHALLEKQEKIKTLERVRKLRQIKKFGKKMQKGPPTKHEATEWKRNESIKSSRNDAQLSSSKSSTSTASVNHMNRIRTTIRKKKDIKYGFGAKKALRKRNGSGKSRNLARPKAALYKTVTGARRKTPKAKRLGKRRRTMQR